MCQRESIKCLFHCFPLLITFSDKNLQLLSTRNMFNFAGSYDFTRKPCVIRNGFIYEQNMTKSPLINSAKWGSLAPHFKVSFYLPFICIVQAIPAFQFFNEWMQKWHALLQYHHQTQYVMSLILLIHPAIVFALSSVTQFLTVRLWWLPALLPLLAETVTYSLHDEAFGFYV